MKTITTTISMIKINIKPSYTARKYFSFIDFNTLSEVVTIIYNASIPKAPAKPRSVLLKLNLSKKINYYKWGTNSIYLFEREYKNQLRSFFSLFLHEFRHWYQCKVLKVSFDKNYSYNGMAYYKCPIEKDARHFGSNLASTSMQIYKKIIEAKRLINEVKGIDHGFK